MLPLLNLDDILIYDNMGAYSITITSAFNSFPKPKIEYYIEEAYMYVECFCFFK